MHAVILDECRECFVNYNVIMASLSIIDYTINQQIKLCTWNNCVVTVRVAIHILHSITFQQLCALKPSARVSKTTRVLRQE